MLKILLILLVCHQALSQCFKSGPYVATCKLNTISANTLRDVTTLKRLYVLGDENCREIQMDAFAFTANLEYVKIQDSHLDKLYAGTFDNLPLKQIDLSRNQLSYVEAGAFVNLPQLSWLLLHHNHLSRIPRGVFARLPLRKLSLSYNRISTIDDYALDLYDLQRLYLDNNRIEEINLYRVLSRPGCLETLWLKNNSIKSVTKSMLYGLTNLKQLNLGFNKIESVEHGAFEPTARLVTLVLTRNRLKEIDGDVFAAQGMNMLRYLYLGYNRLMFLYPDFFSRLHTLKNVMLMGNPWICSCYDDINNTLTSLDVSEYHSNKYHEMKTPLCILNRDSASACPYKYDARLSTKYFKYLNTNLIDRSSFYS